jgi:hypothetical protein
MFARTALAIATLMVLGCNSQPAALAVKPALAVTPAVAPKAPAVVPASSGRGAEVIRAFWALVDRDQAAAAAAMLDPSAAPDDATRAVWRANFESIDAVQVSGVVPWEQGAWAPGVERYQVTLAIRTKPEDPARAPPIPHYGWEDGSNVRWMEIRVSGATGLVASIATGP